MVLGRAQGDRVALRCSSYRWAASSTSELECPRAWLRSRRRERVLKFLTLTAEPGVIGGVPQGGINFGAALNPEAVLQQNQQVDFYDGGGLDARLPRDAQADTAGNVNVSRFDAISGRRGLSSTSAEREESAVPRHLHRRRPRGLVVEGKLLIERDGQYQKFVEEVEHGHSPGRTPRSRERTSFTSPSGAYSGSPPKAWS